ncbi:MAG: reverse transcriptase domain-containing protein [Bacteroidota bacterium]
MFDHLASLPTLARALRRVKERRPTVGSDGERADDLGEPDLRQLQHELISGAYTPRPLRRISVEKSGGGARAVFLVAARDRIAQTAALFALRPAVDRLLLPSAFAYRRGRSHLDAVRAVEAYRKSGRSHVYRGDVKDFFETIDRERLLRLVHAVAGDGRVVRLVQAWLRDPMTGGAGVPAGSVIAPLLSNLYLVPFDRAFARQGVDLVRFGDDLACPAPSAAHAEHAAHLASAAARALGLTMNAEKSHVATYAEGFRFLGHRFGPAGPRKIEKDPPPPPTPSAPSPWDAPWTPTPPPPSPHVDRPIDLAVAGPAAPVQPDAFDLGAGWTSPVPSPAPDPASALAYTPGPTPFDLPLDTGSPGAASLGARPAAVPPPISAHDAPPATCPVHATPPPPSAPCTCTPPAPASPSTPDASWWLPPARRRRSY